MRWLEAELSNAPVNHPDLSCLIVITLTHSFPEWRILAWPRFTALIKALTRLQSRLWLFFQSFEKNESGCRICLYDIFTPEIVNWIGCWHDFSASCHMDPFTRVLEQMKYSYWILPKNESVDDCNVNVIYDQTFTSTVSSWLYHITGFYIELNLNRTCRPHGKNFGKAMMNEHLLKLTFWESKQRSKKLWEAPGLTFKWY